jgi:predicted GIY-YIG superfamily endonuclease
MFLCDEVHELRVPIITAQLRVATSGQHLHSQLFMASGHRKISSDTFDETANTPFQCRPISRLSRQQKVWLRESRITDLRWTAQTATMVSAVRSTPAMKKVPQEQSKEAHLDDASADFKHGNIKSAASKIKHEDGLILLQVNAKRER